MRGDEDLGIDASHLDVGRVGDIHRQRARRGPEGVGVEGGALVALPHHVDHPVKADALAARRRGRNQHQIVELHALPVKDADPELERRGIDGAEDEADGVRHAWPPGRSDRRCGGEADEGRPGAAAGGSRARSAAGSAVRGVAAAAGEAGEGSRRGVGGGGLREPDRLGDLQAHDAGQVGITGAGRRQTQ
jgi:hypothetical protein